MRNFQAPHSTENELAVLGALLVTSGKAYDRIAATLKEDDLYLEEHRLIYRAIEAMVKVSRPADAITVAEWLESNKLLDKAGGRTYLNEIAKSAPPAANIIRYAEIIVERRMARQLIAAAQDLQDIAYESGDVHGRMARAQSLLLELGEANQTGEPVSIQQVLTETLEWVQDAHESGHGITGLSTGIDELDKKTAGLQDSDLIIIAGRPSMGKTALAQNIAENMAEAGGSALVFSLEMSRRQSGLRTLASRGSVNLGSLMNPASINDDDTWSRLCEALARMENKKLFIDDSSCLTVQQMHAKARRHKRRHGLGLIVIDYLQLIQLMQAEARGGRTEGVSEISRGLKNMAKSLGVPVVALSQLNRSVESRADKRPMMSDLRESGAIEQDADVIMLLYRDDYYNKASKFPGVTEVIIAKQRMGATGTVGLLFKGGYSRFENYTGPLPDPEGKPDVVSNGGSGHFTMGP